MKINLPTADEVRQGREDMAKLKEQSLRNVVESFLNGKVRLAIQDAIGNKFSKGVNVEIPIEAYENEDESRCYARGNPSHLESL